MDREKIINKILKCKALGQSDNINEAESAIKMMHKLMETYQISELELGQVDTTNKKDVIVYESTYMWEFMLASKVAEAFNCVAYTQAKTKHLSVIFLYGENGIVQELADDIRQMREDIYNTVKPNLERVKTIKLENGKFARKFSPSEYSIICLMCAMMEQGKEVDQDKLDKLKKKMVDLGKKKEEEEKYRINSYMLGFFEGLWAVNNAHIDEVGDVGKKTEPVNMKKDEGIGNAVTKTQTGELSSKELNLREGLQLNDAKVYIDTFLYNWGFSDGNKYGIDWQ